MSDQEGFNITANFDDAVQQFDKLKRAIDNYNAATFYAGKKAKEFGEALKIATPAHNTVEYIENIAKAANSAGGAFSTLTVNLDRTASHIEGITTKFYKLRQEQADVDFSKINSYQAGGSTSDTTRQEIKAQDELNTKLKREFEQHLLNLDITERQTKALERKLKKQEKINEAFDQYVKQGRLNLLGDRAKTTTLNDRFEAVDSRLSADAQVEAAARRIKREANMRAVLEAKFAVASGSRIGKDVDRRPNLSEIELNKLHGTAISENRKFDSAITGRGGTGVDLAQSARYFATYRALSLVQDTLKDGAKAAYEFSKGIAEIQTITTQSTKTFEDFRKEILGVSNIFGFKVEDVTKATYQAISNQVVDAGNSFNFMAESAKFARITNSTLTEAVDLGSSALNSYSANAVQANAYFASLFKTIELGRVRADEIANSFGSVAVLANQLGVSMNETGAGLAALTVNGITADNAMTLLRNVMIKLIKPTEDMQELLDDMGFATGQAAIQAHGFTGFMDLLFKEISGNTARTGELVNNIRAIQGVMGLAKGGTQGFAETLEKFTGVVESYNGAVSKVIEDSPAQNINKQLNELRNSFVNLGVDAVKAIDAVTPSGQGLVIIVNLMEAALVAYAAKLIFVKLETYALMDATVALKNVWAVIAANPVGVAIIAFGAALSIAAARQREFNEALLKGNATALTDYTNKLNNEMAPALENIAKNFSRMGLAIAEERKIAVRNFNEQAAAVERLKDATIRAYEEQTSKVKEELTKIHELQNKNNSDMGASRNKLAEEKDKQRREDFEAEIANLSDIEKAKRLRIQSEIDQNRAKKLARPGTMDQSRKLADQAIKDAKEAEKLDPSAAKGSSIDVNILLRKREQAVRDLGRLSKLENLGGVKEKESVAGRKQIILDTLQELDDKISEARGKPKMGRPDDGTAKINKAEQTKVDIENLFQAKVRESNSALEAQAMLAEKINDSLKAGRDRFGDLLKQVNDKGRSPEKTAKLLEDLQNLAVNSEGAIQAAVQALMGAIKSEATGQQGVKASGSKADRLGENQKEVNEALKKIAEIKTKIAKADMQAIEAMADTRDSIAGKGIFKEMRDRAKLITTTEDPEDRRRVATLTPAERRSIFQEVTNQGKRSNVTGDVLGVENDFLIASKKAADALRVTNGLIAQMGEIIKQTIVKMTTVVPTITPVKNPGDTKAAGGYSVGGGIHHPGEFIVNKKESNKYRTLLENINQGKTEAYLKNPGSIPYFDPLSILKDFSKLHISGVPLLNMDLSAGRFNYGFGSVPSLPREFGGFGDTYPGAVLDHDLLGGLRSLLSRESGLDYSNYGKLGTSISPQIYPNFQGQGTARPDGGKSYQFGNINISIGGAGDSRSIADAIRRDIARSLSTLS